MDHEFIRATFVYEDTGTLRKVSEGTRNPYPWRPAGQGGRYLITTVNGYGTFYLHRAVWFYHHGVMPTIIDHINGDTRDNRIENLRECTREQNQYNSKRKVSNRSGVKGVVFHPKCPLKPWQAKITVAKKIISLGYFADLADAATAYENAARQYAGEFARPDATKHQIVLANVVSVC